MFNLLPESEKKEILTEYSNRRFVVLLLFLFVSGLIAIVAIFPSRILSVAKGLEVERQMEQVKHSPILEEEESVRATLNDTNAKLKVLKTAEDSEVADLFSRIISKRGSLVKINYLSFRRANKDSKDNSSMITVAGIASDRESLSTFVKALQSEKIFLSVDLPVSNFTKDRNAPFTIQIKGKF